MHFTFEFCHCLVGVGSQLNSTSGGVSNHTASEM